MTVHEVVGLRKVLAPAVSRAGARWMTLEAARAAGVDLSYVGDGIGPRVRGMVYRGGYQSTVNTVHEVFVEVRPDGFTMFRTLRAVSWVIAEENSSNHGRIRSHMTSWEYDSRNQPLFMIED